jgi:hypothetical protein
MTYQNAFVGDILDAHAKAVTVNTRSDCHEFLKPPNGYGMTVNGQHESGLTF